MNFITRFFFLIVFSTALFSCKNEVKNSTQNIENNTTESLDVPVLENIEVNTNQEDQANSVMVKSMITSDLKTFSSFLVTAGLGEVLSKGKGPYTIIGPSNEAFKSLGQEQMKELLNTLNKEELVQLIKGHVIEGNFDSAALIKYIDEGNGSFTMTAMSGTSYITSKDGETIIITDDNGVSARIVAKDLKGTNGVVHVLDKVLNVN